MIGNGLIKAVEKVWIDSFTYSAVVTTADTILIGYIPAGCKVVGLEVFLPVGFAPTNATINVGMSYSTSLFITSSTAYLYNPGILGGTQGTSVVANVVRMNNPLGMNFSPTSSTSTVSGGTIVLNATQGVYLSLGVIAMSAPTAGTIQTIIRYTS